MIRVEPSRLNLFEWTLELDFGKRACCSALLNENTLSMLILTIHSYNIMYV